MAKKDYYFSKLPKKELVELSSKGGVTHRSPQLQRAWLEKDKIKSLYKTGTTTIELADVYKINRRAVYRIIND